MSKELIDLSKQIIKSQDWNKVDVVLLVTTGGLGFLAREAYKHFFPANPSVQEQLEALSKLIEKARGAGVKQLKVRLSASANAVTGAIFNGVKVRILRSADNSIDLELTFAERRRSGTTEHRRQPRPTKA